MVAISPSLDHRKGFHLLILQGLVDYDYRFFDMCVGWLGKVHDARVFKNSPLFALFCARTFLPLDMSVMIPGVRVPPVILGDSAYAVSDWLIKPYTVIAACCVLHNYCENLHEFFADQWLNVHA